MQKVKLVEKDMYLQKCLIFLNTSSYRLERIIVQKKTDGGEECALWDRSTKNSSIDKKNIPDS